jgi:hypothetical protein
MKRNNSEGPRVGWVEPRVSPTIDAWWDSLKARASLRRSPKFGIFRANKSTGPNLGVGVRLDQLLSSPLSFHMPRLARPLPERRTPSGSLRARVGSKPIRAVPERTQFERRVLANGTKPIRAVPERTQFRRNRLTPVRSQFEPCRNEPNSACHRMPESMDVAVALPLRVDRADRVLALLGATEAVSSAVAQGGLPCSKGRG